MSTWWFERSGAFQFYKLLFSNAAGRFFVVRFNVVLLRAVLCSLNDPAKHARKGPCVMQKFDC